MAEKYGSVENMTLREKISHYWGYYWWVVLAVVGLLGLIAFNWIITAQNPSYDTSVLMMTRGKNLGATTPLVETLQEKISSYGEDLNHNDKTEVLCDLIALPATEYDGMMNQSMQAIQTRLLGELQLGDSQVFLVDQAMFDYINAMNGFEPLSNVFPEYQFEHEFIIPLKDTALYDIVIPPPEEGLGTMTKKEYNQNNLAVLDDLYVGVRKDMGLKPDRREAQIQLLGRILADSGLPAAE